MHLMTKKKKINPQKQEEFFDDCPICQALKEGKTSFEDLKGAFKKAKNQGAIVGGSLFEDGEN